MQINGEQRMGRYELDLSMKEWEEHEKYPGKDHKFIVKEVIDGETLMTESETTIRIYGVDVPKKGTRNWQNARKDLESLLHQSTHFTIKKEMGRGKDGLIIAKIECCHGDVTDAMKKKGWGVISKKVKSQSHGNKTHEKYMKHK